MTQDSSDDRPMGDGGNQLFLSYSRRDLDFVAWLRARLPETIDVWWDQECMPSRGLTFLQEIRDAIHECERTVVVFGRDTLESEYVRAEWQQALIEEKVVIPVVLDGKPEDLPAELKSLHCVDFAKLGRDRGLKELLRVLDQDPPLLGRIHGALPLPPAHFRPRPDDLTRLAEFVLYDLRHPVTLSPPEQVTFLHGQGGVGKSVLAAAFARATSTRRVFGDGVVWVHVGKSTEVAEVLERIGTALGFAALGGNASEHLSERLRESRCLLVLDDVWEPGPLREALKLLGPNGRLVATGRSRPQRGLGLRECPLMQMSKQHALELLADWVDQPVDALPPEARDVADACGRLPFALALNGGMVLDGTPWATVLNAVRSAKLTFATSQMLDEYPFPNVLRCIQVSIEALQEGDPDASSRFHELAVFDFVQGVPETAIATLWRRTGELEAADTTVLLNKLERRALARLVGPAGQRRVQLHDLHKAYLSIEADALHLNRKLMDAYADSCGGNWTDLCDDGYVHGHLVGHLVRADREPDAHRLLAAETKDGRNAWFATAESVGQPDAYWRSLAAIRATSGPDLLIRYASCWASVKSLAAQFAGRLLVALVEEKIWGLDQALAYARNITNAVRRANALARLARCTGERRLEVLAEAIDAAGVGPARTWHATPVFRHLGLDVDDMAVLAPRVLAIVAGFDAQNQGCAIADLAATFTGSHLQEAVRIAHEIEEPEHRLTANCALYARVTQEVQARLDGEILADFKSLEGFKRERAWGLLAPLTPAKEIRTMLRAALNESPRRALDLIVLWPYADSVALQRELLQKSSEFVRGNEGYHRASDFASLVAATTQMVERAGDARELATPLSGLQDESLAACEEVDLQNRFRVLERLVDYLRNDQLPAAVDLGLAERPDRGIDRSWEWFWRGITARLPAALLRRLREAPAELLPIDVPVQATVALIDHVADSERARLVAEAIEEARSIGLSHHRTALLLAIAEKQSEPARRAVVRSALDEARRIGDVRVRRRSWVRLAACLARKGHADRSLALVSASADQELVADALVELAPHLGKEQSEAARDLADSIADDRLRAKAVCALLPQFDPASRKTRARELVELAASWDAADRGPVVTACLSELDAPQRDDAVRWAIDAVAGAEDDARWVEPLLAGIARVVEGESLSAIFRAACRAKLMLRDDLLIQIADRIAATAGPSAMLKAVAHVEEEYDRGQVLRKTAGRVTPGDIDQAAKLAAGLDDWSRAHVLAALSDAVPEPARTKLLRDSLQAAESPALRAELGVRLPTADREAMLSDVIQEIAGIEYEHDRMSALDAAGPYLTETAALAALMVASRIESVDWWRVQACVVLAPALPEASVLDVAKAARELGFEKVGIGANTRLVKTLAGLGHFYTALEVTREAYTTGGREDAIKAITEASPPDNVLAPLVDLACAVEDFGRVGTLQTLAAHLAQTSSGTADAMLRRILNALSDYPRAQFVCDLAAIEELLFAVGGPDCLTAAMNALDTTARWWP